MRYNLQITIINSSSIFINIRKYNKKKHLTGFQFSRFIPSTSHFFFGFKPKGNKSRGFGSKPPRGGGGGPLNPGGGGGGGGGGPKPPLIKGGGGGGGGGGGPPPAEEPMSKLGGGGGAGIGGGGGIPDV